MLRTKLLIAFSTCLAAVLALAVLLFWGPEQMARRLDRSLLAHQQAEAYLRLSGETYRHFWHLADQLIAAEAVDGKVRSGSREQIHRQIRDLERLTIAELRFVGAHEPEEWQELLRIKQLASSIAASIVAFNDVLDGNGGQPDASRKLALLQQKVDRDFASLIEFAIADESEEAAASDAEARDLVGRLRIFATVLAGLAVFLVGGSGYWLLRSVKHPIERLLEGTRQLAAGELGHRIRLRGRNELAHLAASFNAMASDLERQRSALMDAQTGLEQRVETRTAELRQANLTLQRLDELRRRMFADISHELRTPLTVISGEAEVTLRSRNAGIDDHRAALSHIVDLTGQVARLVEDLMILARSDAADLRIEKQPVDMQMLLRESVEDFRALAGSKAIDVTLDAPEEPRLVVDADPGRIGQLLLILVDNACRYTPAEGTIDVSLERAGSSAVVRVADSGVGIPADEIDQVFERYFRGAQVEQLAPKGVGLGLHVARSIALAHDGRLALESEPGCGTTAALSLPLLKAERHADSSD